MSRFGIKKTKFDITFAKFIKLRDKCCQKCGKTTGQLECSHIFSRRNQGIRCDPRNAKLLCSEHHREYHANPLKSAEWVHAVMGETEYVKLLRLAKTPSKMSTFDKDYIRKEQQELIKQIESGEIVPVPWVKMWKTK